MNILFDVRVCMSLGSTNFNIQTFVIPLLNVWDLLFFYSCGPMHYIFLIYLNIWEKKYLGMRNFIISRYKSHSIYVNENACVWVSIRIYANTWTKMKRMISAQAHCTSVVLVLTLKGVCMLEHFTHIQTIY